MAEAPCETDVADEVAHLHLGSSPGVKASPPGSLNGECDEEEEESEHSVLVGFLQKPEHPRSLSRHLFPSKAGGVPAWLDPVNLPQGEEILCGICEKPLQFLLQVYAPIDKRDDSFHRTLLVFMCPDMNCFRKHMEYQSQQPVQERPHCSVKVFRCQLRRVNEFYSTDPAKGNGLDGPISEGASLCSWCGTWKGVKICGGCKKARYCSRDHQVKHWKSVHAAFCKAQSDNPTNPSDGKKWRGQEEASLHQADADRVACCKLWPEFEIVDDEEGSDEDSASNGSTAIVGLGREDDISRQFQEVEPSLEQQHWASFQARIARAPDQVIRYCRSHEAKPLWPRLDERPPTSGIPSCPNCKARRIFEFQILSQLLYYFKVSNEPDALDWGTLAIYTCEASCTSSRAYSKEFVWMQSA